MVNRSVPFVGGAVGSVSAGAGFKYSLASDDDGRDFWGFARDARGLFCVSEDGFRQVDLPGCAPRQFRLDQSVVGLGVPLTDAQWARIEPLLPDRTPKRGGRWRDHREVIDAIAYKFQTGTQWVHLPERYGNWRGVYNRLRMWAVDGTWERVFTALVAQADADEDLNWAVSVDSTIVRAHQHAAGARKKGPRPANRMTMPSAGPAAD